MSDTNQKDRLTRALRRLKEDDQAMTASPAVEARLLDEVRRLQNPQRGWSRYLLPSMAVAAIVLVGLSLMRWKWVTPVAPPPALVAQESTTEFFPLFYSSVPAAQTHLVRLELPGESLARFGLMSADVIDLTRGTVLADVLVGDDGLARAVRFVQKRSQEHRQ